MPPGGNVFLANRPPVSIAPMAPPARPIAPIKTTSGSKQTLLNQPTALRLRSLDIHGLTKIQIACTTFLRVAEKIERLHNDGKHAADGEAVKILLTTNVKKIAQQLTPYTKRSAVIHCFVHCQVEQLNVVRDSKLSAKEKWTSLAKLVKQIAEDLERVREVCRRLLQKANPTAGSKLEALDDDGDTIMAEAPVSV